MMYDVAMQLEKLDNVLYMQLHCALYPVRYALLVSALLCYSYIEVL